VSEVPPGWTIARLGDLGDVRLGKMLDKVKNRGLPTRYLRNINVRWFKFDLTDLQRLLVSEDERELLSVQDGDLFICEGGEPGRCAVWRNGTSSLVYQKALHRFRTSGAIVPELLMYRLRHDADSGALQDAFTGTTIKHLTRESLSRYEIPLPPINEQKRITDKLDTILARVNACRERLDRVPAILKRYRQAVLVAATSGKLTEEWRNEHGDHPWGSTMLGACGVVSGGLTKNANRQSHGLKKRYLRVANVYANRLDLSDVAEIGLTEAEHTKTRLRPGDLLIVEGNGSLDQLGRVALWSGELDDCVHQNHLIRWRSSGPSSNFVLLWLLSPQGRSDLTDLASTTTGLHTLSISKVSALPIQLPSSQEQAEIVRRVEALFAYVDRLEARYTAACAQVERLTPALLAKAFRGDLVPQDPNDEPASVLLERIRATRVVSEGTAGPKRRKGGGRSKTSRKSDVLMLTRKGVQDTHLTTLL
jgi:type I restriction enzyme S subunit